MSHLKKRATRIHQKLGTASFIVACIALVAALGGTALAAKGLFTKPQEKKIIAIAKKYAKAGPTGPQGPAGTNGTNGEKGAKGDPGENGKSVVVTPISVGASGECNKLGGAWVEKEGDASSAAEVCNGEPGVLHPGETLPKGATETGTWVMIGTGGAAYTTISFPIELAAELDSAHALKEGDAEFATKCTGTSEAPTAPSGYLCVYARLAGKFPEGILRMSLTAAGASINGAVLKDSTSTAGALSGIGGWAVTG